MSAVYSTDLAERNKQLQQDVIALRHALERAQQEKAAMLQQVNEFRFKHEQTIRRLNATIEEFLK
jgi:Skp family chaperone for outer membrane proteins